MDDFSFWNTLLLHSTLGSSLCPLALLQYCVKMTMAGRVCSMHKSVHQGTGGEDSSLSNTMYH